MADAKFLVVGLVRSCAKTIELDFRRISAAVGASKWFVVESDSSDASVSRLEQMQRDNANFRFVSLGNLRSTIPGRTDRIAVCRNRYLEEIAQNPEYRDVDYVVVADLDSINTMISRDAFKTCFERDDWDVCAANQQGPYYDVLALRHPTWSPSDCLEQFRQLMHSGASEWKALSLAVYSKMITISDQAEWMPVSSAFGGFAVYKQKIFGASRYSGRDSNGLEICEHVPFHENLGARIFINPRLVNAGYTEHSRPLQFIFGLKLRAKIFAKFVIRSAFGLERLESLKQTFRGVR